MNRNSDDSFQSISNLQMSFSNDKAVDNTNVPLSALGVAHALTPQK